MSETIRKAKLLEWCDLQYADIGQPHAFKFGIGAVAKEVKRGTFDLLPTDVDVKMIKRKLEREGRTCGVDELFDQLLTKLAEKEAQRNHHQQIMLSATADNERLRRVLNEASEALEKAERFVSRIMEFHGQNLQVANWHQNDDLEPWDNFFDENMNGDELDVLRAAIKTIKGDTP